MLLVNEQGVVYLFGMVSFELGFIIKAIGTEYPPAPLGGAS